MCEEALTSHECIQSDWSHNKHFCPCPQNLQAYLLLFVFLLERTFGNILRLKKVKIIIVVDTLDCKYRGGVFTVVNRSFNLISEEFFTFRIGGCT